MLGTSMRNLKFKYNLNVIGLSIVFSYLLLSKIAWQIWDTGCPTYTLNMINQIRSGRFPASFPGVPEIAANYHQGHLVISAVIGELFKLDSLSALRICIFVFSVAGFFILASASARVFGRGFGPLIILFCYLISSFPNAQTWPITANGLGPYEYLSIFEYLVSPSWPIAIFLCSLTFTRIHDSEKITFRVLVLLVFLPFFNATLFTTIFIALVIHLMFELKKKISQRKELNLILIQIAFATCIYIAKNYTVSAFKTGVDYDSPKIGIRLFQDNWLSFVSYYIKLQTPLIIIGIAIIMSIVIKGQKQDFYSYFFMTSLFFPVVFEIQGVDFWDNSHKFVLASGFSSIILMLKYHEKNKAPSRPRILLVILCLSLLNFPSQYNDVKTRWNDDIAKVFQVEKPTILSEYLSQSDRNKMLWLYSEGNLDICGPFTRILNETNVFAAGFYWSNFLLSSKWETMAARDSEFYKVLPIETLKIYSDYLHLIVVPVVLVDQFTNEPEFKKGSFSYLKNIDDYAVYSFKSVSP
jgi:hypothetical protein